MNACTNRMSATGSRADATLGLPMLGLFLLHPLNGSRLCLSETETYIKLPPPSQLPQPPPPPPPLPLPTCHYGASSTVKLRHHQPCRRHPAVKFIELLHISIGPSHLSVESADSLLIRVDSVECQSPRRLAPLVCVPTNLLAPTPLHECGRTRTGNRSQMRRLAACQQAGAAAVAGRGSPL